MENPENLHLELQESFTLKTEPDRIAEASP